MVETDKLKSLIDQLRLTVPQDVLAAREILHNKDAIVNQAAVEARRLKSKAEDEFRNRIDQSEVLKAARRKSDDVIEEGHERAQKLLNQSEYEAKKRRSDSDAYAFDILKSLENELASVLGTVRRGLEVIESTSQRR